MVMMVIFIIIIKVWFNNNNDSNNNNDDNNYNQRIGKKLWNMKVTVIPIVISVFGTIIKGLV